MMVLYATDHERQLIVASPAEQAQAAALADEVEASYR